MSVWPITIDDVRSARERIAPHLVPTPLRSYGTLDAAAGAGIRVLVKHENFQPTGAFKVRNAFSALTALDPAERARGVVAATRGNHGLGLAWAARALGAAATVCVPLGNNPEKNAAVRALGARLVEEGRDYDECAAAAERLVREEGFALVHSTNDAAVVAGAGTLTLEILEEAETVDALVYSVGGGSQAVGGLTVARALRPGLPVYGVQAAGASAIHDAWHSGHPVSHPSADTFADGLATRNTYPFTFPALREGLAGFVTVTDSQIAEAVRLVLQTTHTLVEGAGAAGLAGVLALRDALAGKTVAVVLSGANIDLPTLARVVTGRL
jgi:threonine dehydratase